MRRNLVDIKELKQFNRKIQKFSIEKFCRTEAKKLANQLLSMAKKRTPVGETPDYITPAVAKKYWSGYEGGTLKENWHTTLVYKKNGEYIVDVYNPTKYAEYVEYGHRQEVGKFVSQIGKRLKNKRVLGQFMLTKSTLELGRKVPAQLEEHLYKELKRLFDGNRY